MAVCVHWSSAALVFLLVSTVHAQLVQPGAPGKRSKTISAKSVRTAPRPPLDADVAFMQGMIHHHAQAVEMVELLRTRGQSPRLKSFGEKIAVSQADEIQSMKQWLEDRGKPSSMAHEHMGHAMPLMPGMLTPAQMKALAAAKGAEFDRLFLTGMIQHHKGALTMVDDLFGSPGAGQDPVLYDFATDITNTQSAEITLMQKMLEGGK